INFSSNDYLGLASDARIAEALAVGTRTWGAGAGASRLVCGDFLPQHELEAELARFASSEAALLFGSGYAANCGILPSFAGPEDLILSDALNHASIIDGCRLSRARVEVYPHGDVGAVEKALRAPARRKIVVTDAVFSMDGDRAPLRELAALCSAAGALLIVDEAHATGVIGPRGAGLAAELGVAADVRMATLSKAFGVAGAYVAASRAVCDLLLNRARPLIFSTALPPALACAARAHLWHPFTQMQTWVEPLPGDEPVIIDHARGSWLFDTRGRKYLDAISSLWVNVHGHHRPEIDSAIRLQLEHVAHTTLLGLGS